MSGENDPEKDPQKGNSRTPQINPHALECEIVAQDLKELLDRSPPSGEVETIQAYRDLNGIYKTIVNEIGEEPFVSYLCDISESVDDDDYLESKIRHLEPQIKAIQSWPDVSSQVMPTGRFERSQVEDLLSFAHDQLERYHREVKKGNQEVSDKEDAIHGWDKDRIPKEEAKGGGKPSTSFPLDEINDHYMDMEMRIENLVLESQKVLQKFGQQVDLFSKSGWPQPMKQASRLEEKVQNISPQLMKEFEFRLQRIYKNRAMMKQEERQFLWKSLTSKPLAYNFLVMRRKLQSLRRRSHWNRIYTILGPARWAMRKMIESSKRL